jgi:cytolysin (calcineurin-like family phosphatase)
VTSHGLETNERQIAAMKSIQTATSADPAGTHGVWPRGHVTADAGGALTKPVGVVLNGDLTAYFHQWQADLFENLYNDPAQFDLPLFPGLGNHDYANNIRDCYSTRTPSRLLDNNGCAKDAVDFIKAMIADNKVPNFPRGELQSFDNKSLAYSWNVGVWHFVQLHNYPTYTQADVSIDSAIPWLTADLTAATAAHRKIVLNFHDYGDHMPANDPAFLGAIKGQNVVALFAGHIHSEAGLVGTIAGTSIPVFRSGASEYETFLMVEFADTYMNVGVIDSSVSPPRFIDPYNPAMLATYAVPSSGIAMKAQDLPLHFADADAPIPAAGEMSCASSGQRGEGTAAGVLALGGLAMVVRRRRR